MKKAILFLGVLVMAACSWQNHLDRYAQKSPQRKYDVMKESVVLTDSIALDSTRCARTRYYSPNDSILHASTFTCQNGYQIDSMYWNNGSLWYVRIWNRSAPSRQLPKQISRFYDKEGRPLWQIIYQNQPEGDIEYKQYYNEAGELLPEKHQVYYELEEL